MQSSSSMWSLFYELKLPGTSGVETRYPDQAPELLCRLGIEQVQREQILAAIANALNNALSSADEGFLLMQIWIKDLHLVGWPEDVRCTGGESRNLQRQVGMYVIERTVGEGDLSHECCCRLLEVRLYGET